MKNLIRLLCLLLVFPVAIFSFNYIVDPANIFYDTYEETLVDILLSGENAVGVQNMDDRRFLRLYAEQRTEPVSTLVLGSSRAMQITPAVTGDENTFVAGVTGSDLRDVIGGYMLFEQNGLIPETVVLSLEMWYLSAGNVDSRALTDEYEDFCRQAGLEPLRTSSGQAARFKEFFSFPYFQSSVSFALKNGLKKELPAPSADRFADTPVKRADGSYGYETALREASMKEVDQSALDKRIADNIAAYFSGIDLGLCAQLDAFVDYLSDKGVQVHILLSPVHPLYHELMLERPDVYDLVFETEDLYREIAQKYGLPVYGSFDPTAAGVTNADFFDAVHPREEALMRYYDLVTE